MATEDNTPSDSPGSALPALPSSLQNFLANQDFTLFWRGCTLSYRNGHRYVVEAGLKAAIVAADVAVVWEP
jgi:hypothetical protein